VMAIAAAAVAATGFAQMHGRVATRATMPIQYHDVIEIVIFLGALATFVHHLVGLLRRLIVEARVAHESVRDILDATSEAIFIHDARDGKVLSVNEPTLEMFGMSREELVGRTPDIYGSFAPEHDSRMAAEYIRRAVEEGPQAFEWLACRGDGSTFWVEIALRCARIADRSRVVAVVRDISERRRLEHRVREAETLRAVGQLAGGVAHDFNNQLVGILGHAEFLQEALGKNPELRDCADAILVSGRRATELTRQLLAFSRRGRRCNLPVDMHQLIVEVIALGRHSIDKRITILQQLHAPSSVTVGDASALQNALLNLLLNARDAMPKGGTVCFSTRVVDANDAAPNDGAVGSGRCIELKVSDTGIGILPEHINRVFEPFFTTKESGTGMGLAAVQGTIVDHQGTINVTSEPGRGTTFRLMLPLSDASVVMESAPPVAERPVSVGKVLVVDDEATVAAVVGKALRRDGYEVELCYSGHSALELYCPETFDLVLIDIMMPDLDGVEVLQRIRAKAPRAKIMLMTGHADEGLEARMHEFSDVVVLSKPFQPSQLIEEVRKVVAS